MSDNLLKYITPIISPWVNMLAGCLNRGDRALSMTDSSRLAEWLRKTNFQEVIGDDVDLVQAQVCIEIAQHQTTLFLKAGVKEYSQWFRGKENNVTNILSHDFDCSSCELTTIHC